MLTFGTSLDVGKIIKVQLVLTSRFDSRQMTDSWLIFLNSSGLEFEYCINSLEIMALWNFCKWKGL